MSEAGTDSLIRAVRLLDCDLVESLLAEGAPPTSGEIAEYNIILFSAIAMVFIFYFSIMALVNMDVGNDSLLYSKSKSD